MTVMTLWESDAVEVLVGWLIVFRQLVVMTPRFVKKQLRKQMCILSKVHRVTRVEPLSPKIVMTGLANLNRIVHSVVVSVSVALSFSSRSPWALVVLPPLQYSSISGRVFRVMLPKIVAVISVQPVMMLQVVMVIPFVRCRSSRPKMAAAMLEDTLFMKFEMFSR